MPTKIFVGNLSDTSKSEDLQALFEKFGTVVECDILRNFGFVHMQEEEDAKAAIEALNGYHFDGMKMNVEISRSKPKGGRGGGPMRRGGSFRGGARGRGGGGHSDSFDRPPRDRGRSDPYDLPPRDRYDPYDRYLPPPHDLYDLYERRLPLPPLPYERGLPPLPRDYRDRDPYARPPPDYYSRSADRYYDRLYDLQRRYEEDLYDLYYGRERLNFLERSMSGGRPLPSLLDPPGRDPIYGPGPSGRPYPSLGPSPGPAGPGPDSFSREYSQDFTSDSFAGEPASRPRPGEQSGQNNELAKMMFSLAERLQKSAPIPSDSGSYVPLMDAQEQQIGNFNDNSYTPFDS